MSSFQSVGLAGLVVAAIRNAVADPALKEQVESQGRQLTEVRDGFAQLTDRIATLREQLDANDALDADQRETIEGVVAELESLATALAGPADDDEDNGVIAEVEPVPDAPTSDAADEALAAVEG